MFVRFCCVTIPRSAINYTSCACKTNYVAREGRFMTKLIAGSKKKSKHWYPETPTLPVSIFTKPKNPDKTTSRRAVVLNHVFMTHITELMTTGEYAGDIVDEKISITKVKVHPDYKGVNVYWYKKSGIVDENTEILIKKVAGYLHHQLTSLRVIGRVPPVIFVKDKQFFDQAQVDSLLESLSLNNFSSVDPIKIDLGYESETQKLQTDECEDSLPAMRHNVYGLEHSKIMNRLKDIVTRRNLVHSGVRNENEEKIRLSLLSKPKESNYIEFDKREYAKFLKKKQAKSRVSRSNFYADEDYRDPIIYNDGDDADYDFEEEEDASEWHNYREDEER